MDKNEYILTIKKNKSYHYTSSFCEGFHLDDTMHLSKREKGDSHVNNCLYWKW